MEEINDSLFTLKQEQGPRLWSIQLPLIAQWQKSQHLKGNMPSTFKPLMQANSLTKSLPEGLNGQLLVVRLLISDAL